MNAKNGCIQQFVVQIDKACQVEPNYQEKQDMTQPNAFQMINPEEKFTGKHNIDDISCVICFFKYFKLIFYYMEFISKKKIIK